MFIRELGRRLGWFGEDQGVYLGSTSLQLSLRCSAWAAETVIIIKWPNYNITSHQHTHRQLRPRVGGRVVSPGGWILWEDGTRWGDITGVSSGLRLMFRFDLALWDAESLSSSSSVGRCRDCVLGACVAIFSSLHWKLTDCQFDMRWLMFRYDIWMRVRIKTKIARNRIMLDDFVICKMPSVFLSLGIPVSSGPESQVTISPWAFILPLLLISLVIIIILYNVNCQLRCSSYLSSLNFPSAKLLEGETSVWFTE